MQADVSSNLLIINIFFKHHFSYYECENLHVNASHLAYLAEIQSGMN